MNAFDLTQRPSLTLISTGCLKKLAGRSSRERASALKEEYSDGMSRVKHNNYNTKEQGKANIHCLTYTLLKYTQDTLKGLGFLMAFPTQNINR
jgi:hypothetical protein